MFDSIFSRKPVDKKAALAVNQSVCSGDFLTNLTELRNEARRMQDAFIKGDLTPDQKAVLAIKLNAVNQAINKLRVKPEKIMSVAQCFVNICEAKMSQRDFSATLKQAKAMADKINGKT